MGIHEQLNSYIEKGELSPRNYTMLPIEGRLRKICNEDVEKIRELLYKLAYEGDKSDNNIIENNINKEYVDTFVTDKKIDLSINGNDFDKIKVVNSLTIDERVRDLFIKHNMPNIVSFLHAKKTNYNNTNISSMIGEVVSINPGTEVYDSIFGENLLDYIVNKNIGTVLGFKYYYKADNGLENEITIRSMNENEINETRKKDISFKNKYPDSKVIGAVVKFNNKVGFIDTDNLVFDNIKAHRQGSV